MARTALVTGASVGIGAAIARQLLADGFTVYAGARRMELMAALRAAGAHVLALDVTDEASMAAAAAACGPVDVLVNNAGYGSFGALEDVPLSEARRQFEVNVFGLARLTQLVLPGMRARGAGKIVNITSVAGKMHQPFGGWYHATKFAVEGMSDCLRMEVAPFGIDVIVIEPGAIATDWPEVARAHLLKASGAGPYAEGAARHALMLGGAEKAKAASAPEVVALTVSRALKAKRPRTRYAAGGGAKGILLARWLLPDRVFDWVMRIVIAGMAR